MGTEQGLVVNLNKKPKKAVEVQSWLGSEEKGGHGKHLGPVYSVKRNPHHIKYFLSVGGEDLSFLRIFFTFLFENLKYFNP